MRSQILGALATALSGATDAGTNIEKMAPHLNYVSALPHLELRPGGEVLDEEASTIAHSYWVYRVEIVARVRAASDLVLALDNLEKQVHVAIRAAPQLGLSAVLDTYRVETGAVEISGVGDVPVGLLVSVWRIHYRTDYDDPSI